MKDDQRAMTKLEAECVPKGKKHLVVAAVDESVHADAVFEYVARHHNNPDTTVVFVYVARPLDSLFSTSYVTQVSEAREKRYLADGWVKHAQDLKLEMECDARVLVGDPREELILFCEHLKPETLVIGSHGRGMFQRLMLGSVSYYCVHHCPCNVVVVKSKNAGDKGGYNSVYRLAAKALAKQEEAAEESKKKEAALDESGMKKEVESEAEAEGKKKEVVEGKGVMAGPVTGDASSKAVEAEEIHQASAA